MEKTKVILGILILMIASLSLVPEDFVKFMLPGQSATYNATLIRHSCIIVYGISLIVIFLIFHLKKNSFIKYLLGIALVFWGLSLRTFVVVKNYNNTILVSGFTFVPINKCEIIEEDDCDVNFSFFLKEKVKKAISE